MEPWSFLTKHAQVLVCVARDPRARLRDIASTLEITERSAFAIVNDLIISGHVVKEKIGRRNRYSIQSHLPLVEDIARERTVGELLAVLVGTHETGGISDSQDALPYGSEGVLPG